MIYVARNFWTACEESWPEFFLFLGVLSCVLGGLAVSLRMVLGLGNGPEVSLVALLVAYLFWVHWINLNLKNYL